MAEIEPPASSLWWAPRELIGFAAERWHLEHVLRLVGEVEHEQYWHLFQAERHRAIGRYDRAHGQSGADGLSGCRVD